MNKLAFDRAQAISNGWRQCSIFNKASSPILYDQIPSNHQSESYYYLILSHLCSLLNGNLELEPTLEYIVCENIDSIDGNNTYGKNPRVLDLEINELNKLKIRALQRSRGFINKVSIQKEKPLVSSISNEQSVTRWMANRYITTALPDEFESRISKQKSKLAKVFASDIGKKCKSVYINLNEFTIDLQKNENYVLHIFFVLQDSDFKAYFETEDNPNSVFNKFLTNISSKIEGCEGIVLSKATFINEKTLTVAQLESGKLKRWQFDYVSLGKQGMLPTD